MKTVLHWCKITQTAQKKIKTDDRDLSVGRRNRRARSQSDDTTVDRRLLDASAEGNLS
jgi:hypothetical protein